MRSLCAVAMCSVLALGCDSAEKPPAKAAPVTKSDGKKADAGKDANAEPTQEAVKKDAPAEVVAEDDFEYFAEQFADLRILRYQVPGFEELPLDQKKLVYYLSQAALAGRDIIWDQKYRHNLAIRRTLEAVMTGSNADKASGA